MLEFILERYNYWVVIILMLTGLYIVFSRGNLVKTVVGLNVFQTSVFIFYITLGKVAGGTAPILPYPAPEGAHGAYGDDKGHSGYGDDHAQDAAYADGQADAGADAPQEAADHSGAMSDEDAEAFLSGERANELAVNQPGQSSGADDLPTESLHDMPEIDAVNTLSPNVTPPPDMPERVEEGITLSQGASDAAYGADAAHGSAADAAGSAADVLYSNPLPHVLILTAIVVGVATTAVGLALAVRIREAYGTIEEDALEKIDNEAATGSPFGEGGSS